MNDNITFDEALMSFAIEMLQLASLCLTVEILLVLT